MGRRAVIKFVYCNVIVLTVLLAAVTLLGAYAEQISPNQSKLMPFLGLGLMFLLVANVGFAIYWILRLRIWFIIPLIAIIGNHQFIGRIFNPAKTTNIPAVNVLKIATFNTDIFGNEWTAVSTKQLAKYMNEQNVDILCFQEFGKGTERFPFDSVKAAFKDWQYSEIPISPDTLSHLQLAIFSKYPIKEAMFMPFQDTANCSMWCDINICGQTIRLFNLHLQTTSASSNMRDIKKNGRFNLIPSLFDAYERLFFDMSNCFEKRSEQADFIRKKINESPHPVIVCGDFNSLPSSYTYRTILGNDLKDGFCECGHGYMYTFRYAKKLLRIDYIMTSKQLKGIDYFSPHIDFHSDHNPVIMTIKL